MRRDDDLPRRAGDLRPTEGSVAGRCGGTRGAPAQRSPSDSTSVRAWTSLGLPGSGAAGGLAGGLAAVGARIVNGFDVVADAIGFGAALEASTAVITGEGKVDASTLTGKVVARVLDAARAAGRPAGVIAGTIEPGIELEVPARSLSAMESSNTFRDAPILVEAAAFALAQELLGPA